jgi:hypothetical protein
VAGFQFALDNHAVAIVSERGEYQRPIGSGFFLLRPDRLITAKHVVLREGVFRDNLTLVHPSEPTLSLHFLHPELDLAVLVVHPTICTYPLAPAHERMAGSQGLICAGYSPSKSDKAQHRYIMEFNYIQSYTRAGRERQGNEDLVVFEAPYAEPGHSGGPVLGAGGTVVGVVVESFVAEGKTFARATGLQPLVALLDFPSAAGRG